MKKHSQRGEGMASHLIVLALVVLLCVGAASFLGKEIITLIMGGQAPVYKMESKVDKIKINDTPARPEEEEDP